MKRFIFILLTIIASTAKVNAEEPVTKGENKEPIIYVLSDPTEANIANYLKETHFDSSKTIGFYISTLYPEGQVTLQLLSLSENRSLAGMDMELSNRFILIEDKLYPLIFDYDFYFGTRTPLEKIGDYGNRAETFLRTHLICESKSFIIKKL